MGKVAALDVGEARIGVAASDELGIAVHPVTTIQRSNRAKSDLRRVAELLDELGASKVVVGLPLDMNGKEGKQASKVKDFSVRLARRLRIPVEHWDERFSTSEADQMMIETGSTRARRRTRIDEAAASIILESYLRSQKPT